LDKVGKITLSRFHPDFFKKPDKVRMKSVSKDVDGTKEKLS
jgi:hypothetical protein